jgi:hypothetical protein
MRVISKLPKEVIDFYKCHAHIIDIGNGIKFMFLPIWIASTDKEDEFELLHIDKQLPLDLINFLNKEILESQKM